MSSQKPNLKERLIDLAEKRNNMIRQERVLYSYINARCSTFCNMSLTMLTLGINTRESHEKIADELYDITRNFL